MGFVPPDMNEALGATTRTLSREASSGTQTAVARDAETGRRPHDHGPDHEDPRAYLDRGRPLGALALALILALLVLRSRASRYKRERESVAALLRRTIKAAEGKPWATEMLELLSEHFTSTRDALAPRPRLPGRADAGRVRARGFGERGHTGCSRGRNADRHAAPILRAAGTPRKKFVPRPCRPNVEFDIDRAGFWRVEFDHGDSPRRRGARRERDVSRRSARAHDQRRLRSPGARRGARERDHGGLARCARRRGRCSRGAVHEGRPARAR